MKFPTFLLAILLLGALPACAPGENTAAPGPIRYGFEVVAAYPHDTGSFTQGLEFHAGKLYEGTGQKGESRLMEVDLATGKILRTHSLEPQYFGEGITILDGRVFQLTWQNRKGFIYELETFKPLGEFTYRTEGWGLTNNGKELIMSDGTSWLYFLDPATQQVTRRLEVLERGRPVKELNELEWVSGSILANIWNSDELVQIDPSSGQVMSRTSLKGLLPDSERTRNTDVLNGIAWNPNTGKLYVTGKYWPKLYEIKLVPAE